ncbi:hypothetical protein CWC22_010895 [Pseudoalteromonas rubra]|uniref:Uncharacterized protein n=1 Tax=Pseudoalteromonas rubra TaxID=43658 RepID=A0A5S3UQE0_9GAMM|nr:hypothetical protein [Pseudoalteromonas rubra]QPB83466.1 hypothetical protein CWC22_010895 [Pseudoalteromonas rubra]
MLRIILFLYIFLLPYASLGEDKESIKSLLHAEKSRLIKAGKCKKSDFDPPGGWKKSVIKPEPDVFYVHCQVDSKKVTHYFKGTVQYNEKE